MKAWAVEELQDAELGDVRRKKRLMRIVSDLAAQPNASVPQASGNLAATQAAYKFWRITLHQTGSDRISSPTPYIRTSKT
ncbi:MAG: transposase [Moorea sp. SIO2I5]|nr:transposase [Moorena sp. SIO2I5]